MSNGQRSYLERKKNRMKEKERHVHCCVIEEVAELRRRSPQREDSYCRSS